MGYILGNQHGSVNNDTETLSLENRTRAINDSLESRNRSYTRVISVGPISTKILHQRWRRRTRWCLNHFYVEPPECFHRAFASASKSASDTTDASARNYNLDARDFTIGYRCHAMAHVKRQGLDIHRKDLHL